MQSAVPPVFARLSPCLLFRFTRETRRRLLCFPRRGSQAKGQFSPLCAFQPMGAISAKRNAKTTYLFSAFFSYLFYYIYFIDICQTFFRIKLIRLSNTTAARSQLIIPIVGRIQVAKGIDFRIRFIQNFFHHVRQCSLNIVGNIAHIRLRDVGCKPYSALIVKVIDEPEMLTLTFL